MVARALCEAMLRDVIAACDPAARVREALGDPAIASHLAGRRRSAIAIGKAALAMARGAGDVAAGIAIVPRGSGGALPRGWQLMEGSHPEPDAHSLAAGAAVLALVRSLGDNDVLLALLSGGASALAEQPTLPLDDFVATIRGVMAAGAPIDEINTVRSALSAIKAGQLALACAAPVVTLAVSDVIGDPLAVIGSGPTVGPWLAVPGVAVDDGTQARRVRARAILARLGLRVPGVLAGEAPSRAVSRTDHAAIIAPMMSAGRAAIDALRERGISATLVEVPISGDVEDVARALASASNAGAGSGEAGDDARHSGAAGSAATPVHAEEVALAAGEIDEVARARGGRQGAAVAGEVDRARRTVAATSASAAIVAWGEPTLRVPTPHGVGGRAQQLALVLARWLRGGSQSALVVGTDGIDGPPPPDRPSPAGAWVDGTTWDAIAAAGLDPAAALAACDAGTALDAVGALVVTGPSGINHADLVIVG
jgi:glycerate 2-kinase